MAATSPITANPDPDGKGKPPLTRILVVTVALSLGLALLWLSGPRLIAALHMLPGDAIKEEYLPNLLAGRQPYPSAAERQVWRDSRVAALEWVDDPAAWGDLALLDILEARQSQNPAQRKEYLESARDAVIRSIAGSPMNGFMWLRLAAIEMSLDSPAEAALSALEASIRVAPYEPSAFRQRLLIGFRYWEAASEVQHEQLRGQLAMLPAARQLDVLKDLLTRYPERAVDVKAALPDDEWVTALLKKLELSHLTPTPTSGRWS